MQTDSLRKRYIYKLMSDVVSFGIGFVSQAIIPRTLGPKLYGDYSFLTSFFTQVASFLDMGTSTAFYTKLSQRPKENSLLWFYSCFSMLLAFVVMAFTVVAVSTPLKGLLWPEQVSFVVFLAAFWAALSWSGHIVNQLGDAYGLTVPIEKIRMMQRILGLFIIFVLYFFGFLDLINLFAYQYLMFMMVGATIIWIVKEKKLISWKFWLIKVYEAKNFVKEFYTYCHPLFFYSLVATVSSLVERWLLQTFSGSIEQGYYGVSYKIGGFCFMLASPMVPLLMREFSVAFADKNIIQMAKLFERYSPMIYAIVAFFSCFLVLNADKVIYIFGGQEYNQAYWTVVIMVLYPIHQVYGQLCGSIFYAMGETKLYRNVAIVFMVLGVFFSYIFIAPHDMMGLDMGATGLAIKMVVLNIIGVNVMLYLVSVLIGVNFKRLLGHQILIVAVLMVFSFVASIAAKNMFQGTGIMWIFITSGFVYVTLVVAALCIVPKVFGLQRKDIDMMRNFLQDNICRRSS